jgi:hypothetical protein
MQKILLITLFFFITQGLYSQVKLDVGLTYNHNFNTDSATNKNGVALYLGVVTEINSQFAWQVGIKSLFQGGKNYYAFSNNGKPVYEKYSALSLLLPVNGIYRIPQRKWSVAVGLAFGFHQVKRFGATSPSLKDDYDYGQMHFTKENACAGYQVAVYYKLSKILNFFTEYSYSKSQIQKLSTIAIGFRYFI